jgi:hypothetical protein
MRAAPPRGRRWSIACLFLIASRPTEARADPTEADRLFVEAEALMKAGQAPEACARYARSMAIDPAPGTQFRLGECLAATGRRVEAARLLHELEKAMRVRGDETRAKKAGARAEAIEAATPRLKLDMAWGNGVDRLVVELDGRALTESAWQSALLVDAGEHAIHVAAPERGSWTTKVTAGDTAEVVVHVPELTPRVDADRASTSVWPWQRTVGLIGGGAGLVAIGIGAFIVFDAKSDYEDVTRGCGAGGCPRAQADEANDARSRADVGGVFIGAGVLLLAGGAALWLTAPRSARARLEWAVTPLADGGGVRARAIF